MFQNDSKYLKEFQGIFLGNFFYFISNVQWMKGGCLWMKFIHDYVNNDISNDAIDVICDKEFFPLGFLQKLLFHIIFYFQVHNYGNMQCITK
jgi:hypothetical protein